MVVIERIKKHAKISTYDPPLTDIREGLITFNELVLGITTQEDESVIRNLCKKVQDVENVEIEKFIDIKTDVEGRELISDQLNIRVKLEDLDTIIQLLGDLVVYGQFIRETGGKDTYSRYTRENLLNFERTISNIQDLVIKMRLVPMESILNRFPRMVRTISREEGKNVDVIVSGKNIGIDRSIIEQLVDPLTHIMRNAVSHGIELPEDRVKAGKDKSGLILLSVSQEKSEIIIEIRDDGGGIKYDLVKKKAVEKGYIEADAELTTDEVHYILLNHEISTRETADEISGRGVGLSSIKKSIDDVGGSVEIESQPGSYTILKLILPLSVAINKILLLTVKNHQFALPMGNIQQILSVPQDKFFKTSSGICLLVNEEPVPVVNLRERFQFDPLSAAGLTQSSDAERTKEIVVLWQNRGQSLGFIVDDLLGEREVVIKPIHDFLKQIGAFSSATVLEGGQVVLIIDPTNFLEVSA
jgi:two-component system chemotaxis sensor kinase CheA